MNYKNRILNTSNGLKVIDGHWLRRIVYSLTRYKYYFDDSRNIFARAFNNVPSAFILFRIYYCETTTTTTTINQTVFDNRTLSSEICSGVGRRRPVLCRVDRSRSLTNSRKPVSVESERVDLRGFGIPSERRNSVKCTRAHDTIRYDFPARADNTSFSGSIVLK